MSTARQDIAAQRIKQLIKDLNTSIETVSIKQATTIAKTLNKDKHLEPFPLRKDADHLRVWKTHTVLLWCNAINLTGGPPYTAYQLDVQPAQKKAFEELLATLQNTPQNTNS